MCAVWAACCPCWRTVRTPKPRRDYARAVQDYSQALSLDPGNAKARAGLDRAHAAFGQDSYAKAVGTGFAALGAGRLDEARVVLREGARHAPRRRRSADRPPARGRGAECARLCRHAPARPALEAEERWTDAFNEYDAALKIDPRSFSPSRAGPGRRRAPISSSSLQALIDRPERLAAPAVRSEAERWLRRAAGVDPSGPVLRSQIAAAADPAAGVRRPRAPGAGLGQRHAGADPAGRARSARSPSGKSS